MNQLKIITFISTLFKVLIMISLLLIFSGVIVYLFDIYNIFRSSFFIGIPLFLISFICYLFLRITHDFKTKKTVNKLHIILIILCASCISFCLIFIELMKSVC